MPMIDETAAVVRDEEWLYIRIPKSIVLPEGEVHVHQEINNGPVTVTPAHSKLATQARDKWLKAFFAKVDEAHAAGETFELERPFCPPRDVEI